MQTLNVVGWESRGAGGGGPAAGSGMYAQIMLLRAVVCNFDLNRSHVAHAVVYHALASSLETSKQATYRLW